MSIRATVVFAFALMGCEVVFPLNRPIDAGGDDDAPQAEVDANPGAPMILGVKIATPVLARTQTPVTVTIQGTPDTDVHYQLTSDVGGFGATSTGTVHLDAGGIFRLVATWTSPTMPAHAELKAEASYDAQLTVKNELKILIDVLDTLGNYGPFSLTLQLPANTLIAIPVARGGPYPTQLGVIASSSAQVAFAVYDTSGVAGLPGTLETQGTMVVATNLNGNGRTEVPAMASLDGNAHWLVVLFDVDTLVEGDGASPLLKTRIAPASFPSMPPTFPSGPATLDGTFAIYAVLSP